MKKLCLFDLDGTLMDSMDSWANKMLGILREDGIGYPENIINIVTPLGDEGTAKLFSEMGVKGSTEEIIKRMNDYAIKAYSTEIVTKPFVKEFLLKLKNEGHKLAVLTASPHITTDVCLRRNGIYDLFDKVFTVGDFGLTKSQTEIYDETAKRLSVKNSEITFFDDNYTALATAKKAGLECVGVHDKFSDGDTEKIIALCDGYVKTFEELL